MQNENRLLFSNLLFAFVAIASTAIPFYFIVRQENEHYFGSPDIDRVSLILLVLIFTSYVSVAILIWVLRNSFLERLPDWLSIAFCGSLLFILSAFVHARFEHGNWNFVEVERIVYLCLYTLGLAIYTAFFTGLVRLLQKKIFEKHLLS